MGYVDADLAVLVNAVEFHVEKTEHRWASRQADSVPKFMIHLAEVLLIIIVGQTKEIVRSVHSILHFAAFKGEVLKSCIKNVAFCDGLYQHMSEVYIVTNCFEIRSLRVLEVLVSNDHVVFKQDVIKVLQLHVYLVMSAEDFMFGADCCDENTS